MANRMTITRQQKWEEKQFYGCCKRLINTILHKKTWTWLRKGKFKRETESLKITAQNNAIRTNHIKTRIDKTEQNSKCSLCYDKDKTINNIISECRKLAQKEYNSKNDWVGKAIYWKMCKKYKFDHTNKWYKPNPAAVLENNMHKLLWGFDVHTDNLISARRQDRMIIIPIVIGAFGTVTKELMKGLEDLGVSGRVQTIQTTALLRTARILKGVLEIWGDLLSFKLQRKPIS